MHAYLGAKYNPFSKLLFLCPSYVYGTGSIFLNVQYLIRLGLNDVSNDTVSTHDAQGDWYKLAGCIYC